MDFWPDGGVQGLKSTKEAIKDVMVIRYSQYAVLYSSSFVRRVGMRSDRRNVYGCFGSRSYHAKRDTDEFFRHPALFLLQTVLSGARDFRLLIRFSLDVPRARMNSQR